DPSRSAQELLSNRRIAGDGDICEYLRMRNEGETCWGCLDGLPEEQATQASARRPFDEEIRAQRADRDTGDINPEHAHADGERSARELVRGQELVTEFLRQSMGQVKGIRDFT